MIERTINIFKKNKGLLFISFTLIVGIILILYDSATPHQTNTNEQTINTYRQELEGNLESIISNISGIHDVDVLITLESGSEYVYASDESEQSEKHVVVDNNLVMVKERLPTIKGVAVVCTDGNKAQTKIKITELLCSVLNLSPTQVYVTE